MSKIKHVVLGLCLIAPSVYALSELSIPIFATAKSAEGKPLGIINVTETKYGLLFTPNLHDLKPGLHGFHVHENPSCLDDGMAAGGHLDPAKTNHHYGPYQDSGHLGDLPALFVNDDGIATLPVLAPKLLHIKDIQQHALMVHEGGDNYADEPVKLGGGGLRMQCGVVR